MRLDTESDVELIKLAGPLGELLSHDIAALHPGAGPAANGRLDQGGCSGRAFVRHLRGGTEPLEILLDRDVRGGLHPLHDIDERQAEIADPFPDLGAVGTRDQAGLGIPARTQGDFSVFVPDAGDVSEALHIGEITHAVKAVTDFVAGTLSEANCRLHHQRGKGDARATQTLDRIPPRDCSRVLKHASLQG